MYLKGKTPTWAICLPSLIFYNLRYGQKTTSYIVNIELKAGYHFTEIKQGNLEIGHGQISDVM